MSTASSSPARPRSAASSPTSTSTIDRQSKDVKAATANNKIVTQDVRAGRGRQGDPRQVHGARRAAREPGDREGHRGHPLGARQPERAERGRRAADGRRDRRRHARGDRADRLRRRRGGVHERRRRARRPDRQPDQRRRAAGQVTYGEAFNVQPFGNTLVGQDLHGPADLRRAQPAVQQPVGGVQPDHAAVRQRPLPVDGGRRPRRSSTAACRSTAARRSSTRAPATASR